MCIQNILLIKSARTNRHATEALRKKQSGSKQKQNLN